MPIYERAQELETERRQRPAGDVLIESALRHFLVALLKFVSTWWITLIWFGLIYASWSMRLVPQFWATVSAAVLVLVLGFWKFPVLLGFAPLVADFKRLRINVKNRGALRRGNRWLRSVGLASQTDEEVYPVRFHSQELKTVVELDPIPGLSSAKIRDTAQMYKDREDSESMTIESLGAGSTRLTFYKVDPLDESVTIEKPAPFDPEKMEVTCARNRTGEDVTIKFGGFAGSLISGMPGSGKTAGASTFLIPMSKSPDVSLTLIDGKAGTEWDAYKSVAEHFQLVANSEDLVAVRDLLLEARDDMLTRIQTNKEVLGDSNFWNVPASKRRAAGRTFRLIVIDEAHEVYKTAVTSKEDKAVADEIEVLIKTLVKRGRSAGVHVMQLTQKPTADAIPTAIRDNSGLKISFRVDSSEVEKAALGSVPEDLDAPRATGIPSARKGGAIVVTDTGSREAVRFFYMPESAMTKALSGGKDGSE